MKTFIIVTILSVGVLLRPEMAPSGNYIQDQNTIAVAEVTHQAQSLARALTDAQMMGAEGGGALVECYQAKGTNGDTYANCCIDFWFFRLCFEVNLSAIERLIPF
jgi:hypothetical protein